MRLRNLYYGFDNASSVCAAPSAQAWLWHLRCFHDAVGATVPLPYALPLICDQTEIRLVVFFGTSPALADCKHIGCLVRL
jgi:hypothetical protein